jgi:N6-adenosine-specific RNA methylase IME4
MKGVRCSWVDMLKIRDALSAGNRGDQAALERMRCVDQTTVSTWRAACDVLNAIEGKHELTHVSTFQPTHAVEIARALRKREKDPAKWTPEMKEEAADLVHRCEEEELTVKQLREVLVSKANEPPDGGCAVDDLAALVGAGRRFGTIYADPPWRYGNQATRAAAGKEYATMSVEGIAALPVKDLAAEVAHLHLWTTNAFLFECPRLLEAWGFEYKGVFVWCKSQIGIGNYWRVSHEFLVLGVRGGLTFLDRSLRSWAELARDRHSSKPEQVRLLIEKASPPPRLELFARAHRSGDGWTTWGDQIERDLFSQGVEAS